MLLMVKSYIILMAKFQKLNESQNSKKLEINRIDRTKPSIEPIIQTSSLIHENLLTAGYALLLFEGTQCNFIRWIIGQPLIRTRAMQSFD